MHYYTDVLKKYAVFGGRARRKEYWMFVLWNVIISVALSIVLGVIGGIVHNQEVGMISYLYALAVFIPSLAVSSRRLHDTNRSLWWIFICLIPVIGAIIMIVFLAQDSQPGDNKYGPNPKGVISFQAGTVPPVTS